MRILILYERLWIRDPYESLFELETSDGYLTLVLMLSHESHSFSPSPVFTSPRPADKVVRVCLGRD